MEYEQFYFSITFGADPGEQGELGVAVSNDYERVYRDTIRARSITAAFSLSFMPTEEGIQRRELCGETDWDELRLILTDMLVKDEGMSSEKAEYWINILFRYLRGDEEFPTIDEDDLEKLASLTPADFLE